MVEDCMGLPVLPHSERWDEHNPTWSLCFSFRVLSPINPVIQTPKEDHSASQDSPRHRGWARPSDQISLTLFKYITFFSRNVCIHIALKECMKHDKVCGFLIIECSISDAQWCSTFLYDLMLSYYFSLKFLPSRTPLAHFFCACSLGYFYFDGGFPLYLVNLNVNDMLMVVSTGMRGHRVPSWRKWSWKSLVLSHYFFLPMGTSKIQCSRKDHLAIEGTSGHQTCQRHEWCEGERY